MAWGKWPGYAADPTYVEQHEAHCRGNHVFGIRHRHKAHQAHLQARFQFQLLTFSCTLFLGGFEVHISTFSVGHLEKFTTSHLPTALPACSMALRQLAPCSQSWYSCCSSTLLSLETLRRWKFPCENAVSWVSFLKKSLKFRKGHSRC